MTEIQFVGISCNLACAIFGPAWLEYPVCVAGGCVRAGDLPLWGTIVGSAIAVSPPPLVLSGHAASLTPY